MLIRLTKEVRLRSARVLASLYILCVLAPATALAFTDGPTAVHCLISTHGMSGAHEHPDVIHTHADGTTHHHHHDGGATQQKSDSDGKGHPGNCCGLFCMTALPSDATIALAAPVQFTLALPALDNGLAGRGPERINRPPIT
jgi:hypothetical protein